MTRRKKSYPGTLRRKSGGWYLRLNHAGEAYYFTLGRISRADAEEYARHEMQKLKAGRGIRVTMSELLDAYERDMLSALAPKTQKEYLGSIAQFRAFFVKKLKNPPVREVGAPEIRQFLSWREQRDHVAARTLAKDRATLSAIFTYAAREMDVVDANPVRKVKPPKTYTFDPVLIDDDEFDRLVEACADSPMVQTYVLLLGETGLRSDSEALWLRWTDLDLDEGFLWVSSDKSHRTKGGKGRWVPLSARLKQALRAHSLRFRGALYGRGVHKETSEWVFHHEFTKRHHKAGARVHSFYDAFKSAAKRAGLPTALRQHDLRHWRATTWLADGKNPVHVKDALGHADLRTTMAYTHLVREDLRSLTDSEPSRRHANQ